MLDSILKRKRIAKDIVINIIASTICTVCLNFLVYPLYSRRFSAEDYGNIITIIGLINMIWAVLGNCLNNTRLVLNKETDIDNSNGNYNVILATVSIIGPVIAVSVSLLFTRINFLNGVLIFFTVAVGIIRVYLIVTYRLKIDYIAQLITNIIVTTGYAIGAFLAFSYPLWPLSLLCGEGVALIYTLKKSSLISEPYRKTKDWKRVKSTYQDLFGASVITNLLTYFSRFMIQPTLGPAYVSILSVASFWGNSTAPFISPISNVVLSYLSQKQTKVSKQKFIFLFFASTVPLMLFGIMGIYLAPIITRILYPTLVDDAIPYMTIASFGALISCSTNLLMPILLSICPSRQIFRLQVIHFIFYIVVSYAGTKLYGLMGFCIALCVISSFKVALYYIFGYFAVKKSEMNK